MGLLVASKNKTKKNRYGIRFYCPKKGDYISYGDIQKRRDAGELFEFTKRQKLTDQEVHKLIENMIMNWEISTCNDTHLLNRIIKNGGIYEYINKLNNAAIL